MKEKLNKMHLNVKKWYEMKLKKIKYNKIIHKKMK